MNGTGVSDSPPAVLVDTERAWSEAAPALAAAGEIALDIEADGFHRYPERLALLQVGLPDGRIYLIDPLAVARLDALGALFGRAAVPKVLHSAAYDVRALHRDLGFAIRGLFDTAIAAQFCGSRRTGLANVLADFLELAVDKPKHLQRMDWSQRPLPAEAIAYAVEDVAHLLTLKAVLTERLVAWGRLDWVHEECRRQEEARYEPPDPPELAFLGVRGARELSDAERAVLRELFVWREGEAIRIGRPPHRVMSAPALLFLSERPDSKLDQLHGVDRRLLSRPGPRARLVAALERGRAAAPLPWPRRGAQNPWDQASRARLARLKRWRVAEAEALDLDSGVIWPAPHLDQVALHPELPSSALDKGDPPWVRRWQWAALGASLARFRGEALGDAVG